MMKYELSKAGARLAFRDFCNTVNGNAKYIREYEMILNTLLVAAGDTKSRIKAKKYRNAYNRLSEQKMEKVADNQLVFTWFLPHNATVAQNKAKVLQGRAMLNQFGLVR
ncbi:MAG: hypothetical protein E7009_01430 [Alphaproteobacteria bacterium]|nr:hypothetical protein [Alphaproteobacteria bacterium]MBQ3039928.1 hypothetical protein [Alphaproteobacteria bacterium]MBQ7128224.1 hypothetical protein [Alphaproteobacteria bacterium]